LSNPLFLSMKKRYRIKKNSEIDAIFKRRKTRGDSWFSIYFDEDPGASNFRFAISIGKKYGKAHLRNLAKRRIRSIVQIYKNQFIINKLFVIVVKPKASELTYQEMQNKLWILFTKSNIMEKTNE
jgi:ribonuclease P protein component